MHTNLASASAGHWPSLCTLRRLGTLALAAALALTCVALTPSPAWGQFLYGRPIAQPCFDFPNWARFSNCRPGPLPWGYEVFPDYGPADCNCGPDSVACDVDFVAHRPDLWYASADFAPLTLDYQEGFPVARVGPTGPIVLTTNDLQPEFDAGAKFTVGCRVHDCYRVEGTYLGNYDWDDSRVVTNNDLNDEGGFGDLSTFLSGFADPIIEGLDGNNLVSISFESSFQSAEANVRYYAAMPPGPFDVSYLVGARYLRMREQFNFFGQADLPAPGGTENDLQFNTANDLWGVQLGIAGACLKTTRWWLDVDLKGGIYNNHVRLDASFIQNGVEDGYTVTRNRTAWVGDISLVLNWQMTPSCVFRMGYQGIFINGLALAPDQVQSPLFTNTPGPINDGGELAYHGPILGLMWVR